MSVFNRVLGTVILGPQKKKLRPVFDIERIYCFSKWMSRLGMYMSRKLKGSHLNVSCSLFVPFIVFTSQVITKAVVIFRAHHVTSNMKITFNIWRNGNTDSTARGQSWTRDGKQKSAWKWNCRTKGADAEKKQFDYKDGRFLSNLGRLNITYTSQLV